MWTGSRQQGKNQSDYTSMAHPTVKVGILNKGLLKSSDLSSRRSKLIWYEPQEPTQRPIWPDYCRDLDICSTWN